MFSGWRGIPGAEKEETMKRHPADEVTAALDAIAIANTRLTTLEYRNSDSLDFHDMSVGEIRDLMRAAYELGALVATSKGGR